MTNPLAGVHVPPNINFPRIPQEGFIAAIFTFLAIAICGSIFRIGLRLFRLRSFGIDDAFLLLALVALTGACVCMQQIGVSLYLEIYASLHLIQLPKNVDVLLQYHHLLQSAAVLEWVAIFSAKISLLLFSRKLVDRTQKLQALWMVVLVLPPALLPRSWAVSPSIGVLAYLSISFPISWFLSIPACLLWIVRIEYRRKVALAAMLGLSIFQIIITIIRVAVAKVPGDVSDTSWLFFWQTMESAVVIIMVALTGSLSLFQQAASSSKGSSKTYRNSTGDSSHAYNQKSVRDRYGKLSDLESRIVASVGVGDSEELQELKLGDGAGIRVTSHILQESA